MDPAPFWPMPQRSPAEIHHRARLLNVPSSPSSAERYRSRGFAHRGSHNSFATGSSRDSRDGADANLKVGELCDLLLHIIDKNDVHAAKLLLGEIVISDMAKADVNFSKSVFMQQLGDFMDKHKSDLIGARSDIVQRAGSQASTGSPEPEAPDRRNVSSEQSAPGSSSLTQNPVSKMFRFARSLSRAARRCTNFSSTSQSTSPSSTWQIDPSPGSSQGEQRSSGDVNNGDQTRASSRSFTFDTFEPIVPEPPRQEPEVNGQQRDGARRSEGHSQFARHVTVDRGHRGSRERVPGEGASSSRGGVRSDSREQVSSRASANQRAEPSDQAHKARERSSGGVSKSSGDVRAEPSGGGRRGNSKARVLPEGAVVPAGKNQREPGCDAGSDQCVDRASKSRDGRRAPFRSSPRREGMP